MRWRREGSILRGGGSLVVKESGGRRFADSLIRSFSHSPIRFFADSQEVCMDEGRKNEVYLAALAGLL